jgi:hypothetical protein
MSDMIAYFCTMNIYSKNEIHLSNIQKFRSYLSLSTPDLHYKDNCLIAIFEIIAV